MAVLAATIWALTVLIIPDARAHCPSHPEDMIDCNEGLAQVIAPALTVEEQATVTEAMFRRQQSEMESHLASIKPMPGFENWQKGPSLGLDPHMAMAYAHVMRGGKLRIGDIVALHGAVLSALRPDTYALAKKWQALLEMYVKCRDDIACAWF